MKNIGILSFLFVYSLVNTAFNGNEHVINSTPLSTDISELVQIGAESKLDIYTKPACDLVAINYLGFQNRLQFELINLNGEVLKSCKSEIITSEQMKLQVSTENLESSLYFLRFKNTEGILQLRKIAVSE